MSRSIFIMSIPYLMLYVSIGLCTSKAFVAEKCDSYKNSGVRNYCTELIIENGTVCYTHSQNGWWKAAVTCQKQFQLRYQSHRSCYEGPYNDWVWSGTSLESTCFPVTEPPTTASTTITTTIAHATVGTTLTKSTVAVPHITPVSPHSNTTVTTRDGTLDKEVEGHMMVNITVPAILLFSVGVVLSLISLIFIHRRKLSNNGNSSGLATVTHHNSTEDNCCEYEEVVNPDENPNNIDDKEYDEIEIDIDEPTSSIDETLRTSTDTKRVYSKLQIGDKCDNRFDVNESASRDDTLYDNSDTRSRMISSFEANTYDHVNIGQCADNGDLTICQ